MDSLILIRKNVAAERKHAKLEKEEVRCHEVTN